MKCEISADSRLERGDRERERKGERRQHFLLTATLSQHVVRHRLEPCDLRVASPRTLSSPTAIASLARQRRHQGKRAAAQIVLLSTRR